jgi:hypothetical protein
MIHVTVLETQRDDNPTLELNVRHVMLKLERHRNLSEAHATFPTPPATHNPVPTHQTTHNHHNGIRVESRRSHVRRRSSHGARNPQLTSLDSYNRYIAVASRVVRRSLKEDKRIIAERRGESELRFAKWEVGDNDGRMRRG